MTTEAEVQKPKVKKSAKRTKADLIKTVRELNNPDMLRIPKRNPTLQYRWIRNTPDNINLMEAKGYRIATADEVRYCGLVPGIDGACRRGDVVLAVEEMKHHRAHKDAAAELRSRQDEQVRRGMRTRTRAGGFDFDETRREG